MEINIAYWENIFKVRDGICNTIKEMGTQVWENTESINTFYNQIVENGGIGLEIYYGLPSRIYTPLGYIRVATCYTNISDRNKIMERLTEEYGLVTVREETYGSLGVTGPVYAITKLPWSDETLPVFEYKERADYMEHRVAKEKYFQICDELNSK